MQNPQQHDRFENARKVLQTYDLEDLIWDRLTGKPNALPPLTRDEEAADIFVDIVSREAASPLSERIRRASARALKTHQSATGEDVPGLGQLLYLCSRIDSIEAIPALRIVLQRHPAPFARVAERETLRLRAARAYVGLLATDLKRHTEAGHQSQNGQDIAILNWLLGVPDCAIVAAIGLIGLQPERREEILSSFPNAERMINIGLEMAGFPSQSLEGTTAARLL